MKVMPYKTNARVYLWHSQLSRKRYEKPMLHRIFRRKSKELIKKGLEPLWSISKSLPWD